MKHKNIITYILLFLFTGLGLVSCGDKGKGNVKEDNQFYIDSFEYQIEKNQSEGSIELSYSLSFDIVYSLNQSSSIRDLVVRISGTQEKSFRFTVDYSNTENVKLSQSSAAYPYALLYYEAAEGATSIPVNVKLKISTIDLIEDINKFLKIDSYNSKNCKIVDQNQLTNNGVFKISYSDDSSRDIIHYSYNEFTESYEVVSVITKSKSFEIPAMYKDHPVKTIGEGAFKGATDIEELVLPTTITSLPESLLNGMSQLKSLSIPFVGQQDKDGKMIHTFGIIFGNTDYENGIKIKQVSKDVNDTILEYECCIPKNLTKVYITGNNTIPHGAFSNCTMLESIQLDGKIENISDYAFSNCTNIDTFTLPNSVISIGNHAFENFACEGDLSNFKISENVKNIGNNAFTGCDSIKFEIPISYFASEASFFYANTGIRLLSIPFGVKSFSNSLFKDFKTLKEIVIPKSITSFGEDCFSGCEELDTVIYDGTTKEWASITFSNLRANPLSYGNANLIIAGMNRLILSDDITIIKDYAFYGVKNIGAIVLPRVVSIGKSAFANTDSATVTFGSQLTSIGEQAFAGCDKIQSLVIPKSVTTIGYRAFYQTNLKELSVPFIGETESENTFISYWFGGTSYQDNKLIVPTNLKKIVITNATSIPAYGFSGCYKIEQISLESKVTEIKNNAFEACISLGMIELNEEIEKIGNESFLDCISLEAIIIPSNTQVIGLSAFAGCAKLAQIEWKCRNATIKQNAFSDCSSLSKIELNEEIATIEEGAFKNCNGLTRVVLQQPIAIFNDLFLGCSNIEYFETAFIGNEINNFFGYFFGASSFSKGNDFVPSKLTTIVLTGDTIADNAFYNLQGVTNVTIQGTTVGMNAFEKCYSIREVSLGEKLITIKDSAFFDCSSLETVKLPTTLTSIGIDAFNNTYQQTSETKEVCYSGTIDQWAAIDFANDYANPMIFADTFISTYFTNPTKVTSLNFTSAKEIKQYAFYGFSLVTSIKLADTTETIGQSAFASMPNLTKFEAGSALKTIARNAFKSNAKLNEVILNAQLKSIGEYAFLGCSGLATLRYLATVNDWVGITFANQAANPIYAQEAYMLDMLGNFYLLEDVYLGDTINEIAAYAFYLANIKTLHITTSLLKIGNNAFTHCIVTDVYYSGTEEEFMNIENGSAFSNTVTIHYQS